MVGVNESSLRCTRRWLGLVAALAVTCLAAACSSSTADTKSASSPQAKKETAAAQAIVDQYMKAPTKIGQTVALKSKVPAGKTMVFLQCELQACTNIAKGISAGARALGWRLRTVNYQAVDASSVISAFHQALQYNPTVVAITGIPVSTWQTVLPEYRSRHVPIVVSAVGPVDVKDPIVGAAGVRRDYEFPASVLANWFIADSKAGGKALWVTVPSYEVLKEAAGAGVSTVKSKCSGCEVKRLDLTLTQAGNNSIGPAIVSALQRDQSIKYVLSSDGFITAGLSAALSSAGLNDVKIATANGTLTDQQNVANGSEAAAMAFPATQMGWVMVDIAARHAAGMPISDGDGYLPTQLLTKENIGTPQPYLTAPSNFPELYKRLWLVD